MKTKFLLAAAGTIVRVFRDYTEDREAAIKKYNFKLFKDYDPRIYRNDPNVIFHHNDFLFSALFFKSFTKKNTITLYEALGLEKTNTVFIDSGGYSIATGAISRDKWTNEMAFDISMKNGNLFPILDIPVTPNASFDDCLRDSKESAKFYAANRHNAGETILNVAHGRNLGEIKRWVDDISSVKLDGWALGSSHGGNPKEIVKGLFYLLSSGVLKDSKAFHVFGVSSAVMCIYFAAIKHAIKRSGLSYNFDITFDSSYPSRSAAFGKCFQFIKFDGFVNMTLTNTVDWSKLQGDDFEDGMFCDCPVCSKVTDFKGMVTDPKAGGGEFVLWNQMHNIYAMKRYLKQISVLTEMCCDIPELIPNIFPAEIGRNILAIMEAFDNIPSGEEIINRKFVAKEMDDGSATLNGLFD